MGEAGGGEDGAGGIKRAREFVPINDPSAPAIPEELVGRALRVRRGVLFNSL